MGHDRMNCTLFVTSSCSLCDDALDLLLNSRVLSGHALTTIDIISDEALFAELSDVIPVLEINSCRFQWPFNEADIQKALKSE